jgi:hypothetical protein
MILFYPSNCISLMPLLLLAQLARGRIKLVDPPGIVSRWFI